MSLLLGTCLFLFCMVLSIQSKKCIDVFVYDYYKAIEENRKYYSNETATMITYDNGTIEGSFYICIHQPIDNTWTSFGEAFWYKGGSPALKMYPKKGKAVFMDYFMKDNIVVPYLLEGIVGEKTGKLKRQPVIEPDCYRGHGSYDPSAYTSQAPYDGEGAAKIYRDNGELVLHYKARGKKQKRCT